jgi:putative salt-induced outer membrane protein YdiY
VTRSLLTGLCAALIAGPSLAQNTTVAPTFAYADTPKDEALDSGWHVEAKAGLLWLAGNSDSTSLSAGLKITRDAVWQRYSLTAAYAYSKARVYVGPDPSKTLPLGPDGKPIVTSFDDLRADSALSARLWNVTPRFDQWVIHRGAPADTSIYVVGNIASDFAAGKKLFGGGQVGVSTLLIKAGGHSVTGELGYDFTYLQPYDTPGNPAVGYSIHSLRAALAYIWEISKTTKLNAGVEYLVNVNREDGAPNADPNENGVPAFQDHRVNSVVGLTTQVHDRLSLNVSWTGRYDAKPQLSQLPSGVSSASKIFLRTFDSITQVQLVYTFG